MSIYDEVLAANGEYAASFGGKGELALPPTRHFAIQTCMDTRPDPAKYAGLSEGNSHVIRNADPEEYDRVLRPPKTLLQRFGVWMKWNLAILLAGAFGFLYEHLEDG